MKKDSLFTSDRCAGFTTKLKGGCEMFQGSLLNRLARAVASLVLVAAIGHLTAAGVEVHAAPQPSHQDILNQIPPAWSQILPAADRFQLVMGGAAVLDRETGLVWEKSPSTSTFSWLAALFHCYADLEVGGRRGWRPPTIEELASLVDPTQSDPALPTGHPFTPASALTNQTYWSATTNHGLAGEALFVFLGAGHVGSFFKSNTVFVWCVRGGQGIIDGVQ
jgi:hypothetical protein